MPVVWEVKCIWPNNPPHPHTHTQVRYTWKLLDFKQWDEQKGAKVQRKCNAVISCKLEVFRIFDSFFSGKWPKRLFSFSCSTSTCTVQQPPSPVSRQPPHPWPLLMLLVQHTLPSAASPGRSYFKVTCTVRSLSVKAVDVQRRLLPVTGSQTGYSATSS